MRQQLESAIDSYQPRVSEPRQIPYFVVGDLESLSASALYTPKIGSSHFRVSLPLSNTINNGTIISTPKGTSIVNSYQRVVGSSGVDYFNRNGSIAGRLLGLTRSEIRYLKGK